MEDKKVQKADELNDKCLEQVSGGTDQTPVRTQGRVCPKCGKSYGIALLAVSKCPYCDYREDEAFVM